MKCSLLTYFSLLQCQCLLSSTQTIKWRQCTLTRSLRWPHCIISHKYRQLLSFFITMSLFFIFCTFDQTASEAHWWYPRYGYIVLHIPCTDNYYLFLLQCHCFLSPTQTIKRPAMHIDEKLEMAEVRRKAQEEEKVKTVLERSGIDKQNRIR